MVNDVFFIGEINVDLIMGGLESFPVCDREIVCSSVELTIGSSTAICACNYASLGGKASFIGLAGKDGYGDFMVKGLEKFGVDTRLVQRTDKVSTGLTVNLIYGKSRTQVTYPGTISEFGMEHIDWSAARSSSHVHIGGPYLQKSFLPGITSFLQFAADNGITRSLDPQWDSTQEWKYLEEWLPLLNYFFPNLDEARSITGIKDPESACRELAGRTETPVVKTGGEGALVPVDGRIEQASSFPVELVDSTGAGDAFDAGFVFASLEKGMDSFSAARFANAVAARSCRFVGGVNARSSFEQIIEFMEG